MPDKLFTNPTGAYGYTASGDTAGQTVNYFRVADSAAGAVTINRGCAVSLDANGQAVQTATTLTQNIVGVALETVTVADNDALQSLTNPIPFAGPKVVAVCVLGPCQAQVSGTTVTAGLGLSADANGRATTGGATNGQWRLGFSLGSTAGSAGDFKTIYVQPGLV